MIQYPTHRKLVGLQGRSGWVRKVPPPPGFDPRTAQHWLRYPGPPSEYDKTQISCLSKMQFLGRLQIEIVNTFLLASPYMSVCPLRPCLKTRESIKGLMKFDIVELRYFCPNRNLITEQGKCSRYSNWATGWTIQGSNLCREKYFSPERENLLWGPPSLLFNWHRGSFKG